MESFAKGSENKTITSLVQLEYSGFDGATVPVCTFTLENSHSPEFQGGYVRLSDFRGAENQGPRTLDAIQNHDCGWFYRAKGEDFGSVPGTTIAYWLSGPMKTAFAIGEPLDNFAPCRQGLATADNNRFLRDWSEVSQTRIGVRMGSREQARNSHRKWFPYNKGGDFRRWFGNNVTVVNWENDGAELFGNRPKSVIRNPEFFFQKGLTWTLVSSASFGIRYSDCGAVFDVAGSTCFPKESEILSVLGFLASKVAVSMLNAMNPTLNFQVGNIASLPLDQSMLAGLPLDEMIRDIIDLSRSDWDASETSWDFTALPLLSPNHRGKTLEDS